MESMESINNEMEAMANTVREYFPHSPHMAFNVFRRSYPDIIAGTVVALVWNFLEYEEMFSSSKRLEYTRPLVPKDIQMFTEPNILN